MNALRSLVNDLRATGKPSLAWMVEHCQDGDVQAAVQHAWVACDDRFALYDFLRTRLAPPAYRAVVAAADRALDAQRDAQHQTIAAVYTRRYNAVVVAAIRAAMPVAPTVTL